MHVRFKRVGGEGQRQVRMGERHKKPDSHQWEPYTYAKSGVSIAAGNALVKAIAPLARSTARPGADAELGGFGGFFDS